MVTLYIMLKFKPWSHKKPRLWGQTDLVPAKLAVGLIRNQPQIGDSNLEVTRKNAPASWGRTGSTVRAASPGLRTSASGTAPSTSSARPRSTCGWRSSCPTWTRWAASTPSLGPRRSCRPGRRASGGRRVPRSDSPVNEE